MNDGYGTFRFARARDIQRLGFPNAILAPMRRQSPAVAVLGSGRVIGRFSRERRQGPFSCELAPFSV